MKKSFFIISLVLMTAWIAGVFLFKTTPLIHVLLLLSVLSYIRSLMIVGPDPMPLNSK
ncbi:MAG TPA: hypothetical protein VMZ03_07905 [Chitinophagaceae bacterium]|nr:hypothetical protein [Chitinophagaceae bacterium]